MMRNVFARIAAVFSALAMVISVPVFAATVTGTDENGNAVYYMTNEEYMQFYQDNLNSAGSPAPVATLGTVTIYSSSWKQAIAQCDSATGLQKVTVKSTAHYSMSDSSGMVRGDGFKTLAQLTNSAATAEEAKQTAKNWMHSLGLYAFDYAMAYDNNCAPYFAGATNLGNIVITIDPEDLYQSYLLEQTFQTAYIPQLQKYVTNGMSVKDACFKTAEYLADRLTYDYEKYNYIEAVKAHKDTSLYAFSYDPLSTGKGVCFDYAKSFQALLSEIPIGSDGLVNWESGTKGAIDVKYCANNDHAWNAVTYDGALHYFDVTWYDSTGSSRWLDMGYAEQNDGHHTASTMN